MYFLFFFFFSSRRRHTRLTCDWSSDVCSSDLLAPLLGCQRAHGRAPAPRPSEGFGGKDRKLCVVRRLPNQAGLFARKLARESGAPIRSPDPSRVWFEAAR